MALANDRTGSPGRAGIEAIDQATFRVPAQRGRAGGHDCPNWPLAGVPPICTLSVPAAVCVKLPATLSVLPAPKVRFPLLLKPPVVVKRPRREAQGAAVGGQAGQGGDGRPGAAKGDRRRIAGNGRAGRELQGRAVERVPGAAGQGAARDLATKTPREQRAGVGLDRAGVGEGAIDE